MPLTIGFSVCNGAGFFYRALEAALSRSSESFHIVISDNASTDVIQIITKKIAKADRRMVPTRQHQEDPVLQPPEDFDLWSRMAPVCRIANIPEVLTVYREVPGSVSRTGVSPFLTNIIRISTENLTAVIGAEFNKADCQALAELFSGVPGSNSLLPIRKPRKMLRLAAEKIAGKKITWSREFSDTFTSLNRLLMRRMAKAYISASAAGHWLGGSGQNQV